MSGRELRNTDTPESHGESSSSVDQNSSLFDGIPQGTLAIQQLATEALLVPHHNLNYALDLILMILRKTIRGTGYSTIVFTNIQTIFGPWRRGRFFIDRGWFRSPATLFRTGDFTTDTTSESSYLINGSFGLRLLEVVFQKYELTFFGFGARGYAKLHVGENSVNIQVQAEIRQDVCYFKVMTVRLQKLSRISAAITGLWPITYIISKLIPLFVYIFWQPIARSIEISAKNAINEALISAGLQEEEGGGGEEEEEEEGQQQNVDAEMYE